MLENLGDNLESGVVVANAYRLEKVVGSGGMGVVWSAREVASGRVVALKFLHEAQAAGSKQLARFLREARAAMAASHPNIARVEAVLETETGAPFLVMELLEGDALRSLLRQRRTLDPIETARILLPVADAVAAAHAKGIVHRDLKPENVFLVGGTDVRVLDFGIAKRFAVEENETRSASLTSTGAVLGTPAYMAPEQIYGEEDVDGRADVWSLGIMIYECLAGRRPTDADGFGPIMKKVTRDRLVPLEEARPGLPPLLTQLVSRMLTRERVARPSLQEVRGVLSAVLDGITDEVPRTVRLPPSGGTQEYISNPPNPVATTADVALAPTVQQPAALVVQAPPALAPTKQMPVGAKVALVTGVVFTLGLSGALAWRVNDRVTDAMFGAAPPPVPKVAPFASTDSKAARTASPGEQALLYMNALTASNGRDGKGCLHYLDQLDDVTAAPAKPSTDPAGEHALLRSTCLLLAGRCNEGRDRYRAWSAFTAADAGRAPDPKNDAAYLEHVVAESCEGDEATPREALLRVQKRLDANARIDSLRAEPSVCEGWRAEWASRLSRGGAAFEDLATFQSSVDDLVVRCFAKSAHCDEAFRAFKAAPTKKDIGVDLPSKEREAAVRRAYGSLVAGSLCPTPR